MTGFKNAKHITSYAVGMRVKYGSLPWETVVHVKLDGSADTVGGAGASGLLLKEWLPDCTLDLDSVWVGRKYRLKENHTQTCAVLMANADIVCFEITSTNLQCLLLVAKRDNFLYYREPIPLDLTEAPASVAKEEWKPKAGDECMYPDDGYLVRVKVLHVQDLKLDRVSGPDAWITDYHEISRLVGAGCLRPIPPEPPVKPGDVLHVDFSDGQFLIGMATCVEPHRFKLAQGRTRAGNLNGSISDWINFSLVTIRKLVPDTLYAKMKKRLVELRSEADTSRASIASAYMTELLSDLETYAKESQP